MVVCLASSTVSFCWIWLILSRNLSSLNEALKLNSSSLLISLPFECLTRILCFATERDCSVLASSL